MTLLLQQTVPLPPPPLQPSGFSLPAGFRFLLTQFGPQIKGDRGLLILYSVTRSQKFASVVLRSSGLSFLIALVMPMNCRSYTSREA